LSLAPDGGLGYNTRMSLGIVPRCGFFLAFAFLFCTSTMAVAFGHAVQAGGSAGQSASGQQEPTQVPEAPAEQKPGNAAAAEDDKKADYSKEGYVIEQIRARYRFEDDGTGREERSVRVRVQSEAGVQGWGQLRLGYNSANENLDIPYVRVLKGDGAVVTAGADAVQDVNGAVQQFAPVYTDYREKHVSVPGLRPGDVLEYQDVKLLHAPLALGQFWTQYDFVQNGIVLDEQLEIDVPAGRVVKLKNKPGMDPKIAEENGRRIYRWTSTHLVDEDEGKDKNDKDKKKKKKKNADQVADVQMTTFSSWEGVGRWYAGLEKDRRDRRKRFGRRLRN
jgi:hypothetical protein